MLDSGAWKEETCEADMWDPQHKSQKLMSSSKEDVIDEREKRVRDKPLGNTMRKADKQSIFQDFPGGLVVKSAFQCRGVGFDPGWGLGSHLSQGNYLRATTTELACHS